MPDLGPLGRGGARRRTRRRMSAVEKSNEPGSDYPEQTESLDKLEKLAKLLKDKGVITEEEFNLIFN